MNDARGLASRREVDPLKPLGIVALVAGLLTLSPVVQFVTVVAIEKILSNSTSLPTSVPGLELLVVYGPTSVLNALTTTGVAVRISNPRVGSIIGILTGLLTFVFLHSVGPLFVT